MARGWLSPSLLILATGVLLGCADRLSAPSTKSVGPPAGSPPVASAGTEVPRAASLVSAVGGVDELWLAWELGEEGLEYALFVGTDEASLLSGTPEARPDQDGSLVVDGLAKDQSYFSVLASRTGASAPWVRSGPVLELRTGDPVFVDPDADPALADGTRPETAFADPFLAILTALSAGGGDVWLLAGDYQQVALPVFDGVHLYGGFAAGFDLEDRDPFTTPSRLRGAAGFSVLTVSSPVAGVILDGLELDGGGVASIGIDATDSRLSIRAVHVRNCAGRGISLRGGETSLLDVELVSSSSSGNGADGLSARGAYELSLIASDFEANAQEGVEVDDLVAPSGEKAELLVDGCLLAGNGSEGLDVDLAAPIVLSANPGRFSVRVLRSVAAWNGTDGLLIDGDYEAAPGWSANVSVLGCSSRGNGRAGLRLDLDGVASTLVHRMLTSANGTDGITLTSESIAGHTLLSSSASLGNAGYGVRADLGNQVLLTSHCIFGGNRLGGVGSFVTRAGVVSSVAFQQANAWSGATVVGSLESFLPSEALFMTAPEAFARVLGSVGSTVSLEAPLAPLPGAQLEADDDAIARSATVLSPTSLSLDPAPARAPKALFLYPSSGDVVDDFRPAPGSPLLGAGLAAPGLQRDAGAFGSTNGGSPGTLESGRPDPFRFAALTIVAGTLANDSLTLRFSGGELDLSSLTATSLSAIDESGTELDLIASLDANGDLLLEPTTGDLGSEPFLLQLLAGPASKDGEPLIAPLVIPIDPAQR